MLNYQTLTSVTEVLLVTVPTLLIVAFVTIAERKTMGSMQRRLGPNATGYFGLLQPFADALKLLLKEYVGPALANRILFFIGPILTLIFSLLGYVVIPYGPGLTLGDLDLGVLYMLAVSSISTYGILLAGWSANSKYAFLGSLRSTAQLISYELILSSAILIVILLTGSLNLTINVEAQKVVFFVMPLLPIYIIFFIGCIAETNRAPFDLAEAESELVSGFMTEHSAVIFVFFFLAEYASIALICILTSILFIGGYIEIFSFDIIEKFFFIIIIYVIDYFNYLGEPFINVIYVIDYFNYRGGETQINLFNVFFSGLITSLTLGIKSCIMIFVFILARASFPRIRFDQLMSDCWTILLPVIISLIILIPCVVYSLILIPTNFYLI